MSKSCVSDRIAWVDMAKGYGIILVILGHLGVGQLGTWIYSFHMPLFFFLSGYCFHARQPFSVFLKRKLKTMVVPYFALGVPIILYAWLGPWYGPASLDLLGNILKDYILQRGFGDVWFLACLFCLNIFYWFIIAKIPSTAIQITLTVIMPMVGFTYSHCGGGGELPWNVDVSLVAAPFFYTGYKFREHETLIRKLINSTKKEIIAFSAFFVVNICTCFLSKKLCGMNYNMAERNYDIFPLIMVSSFSGIFCMFIIAGRTNFRAIRYIGKNSLLYFAWQEQLGIPACSAILSFIGFMWNDRWNYLLKFCYQILQMFVILLLLTAVNLLISNTKLRFAVGK